MTVVNYFDRINKQLVILGFLYSALLFFVSKTILTDQIIADILTNLCATSIAATVALMFVGYARHKNRKETSKPAYRLAKSSIHTAIYRTILDLGQIYGYPIDPDELFKMRSYEDHRTKILKLVMKLKKIKHVVIDLDYTRIPDSIYKKAPYNIKEIDQIIALYSFALPLEIRIKLLEVRADYKELDFVFAINPITDNLTEPAKTIIAISIFKLKMSVVALYQMLESMGINDTINLVDN